MTDDKRREAVMEMFGGWDWTAGETANWPAAEALYDAGASHADSGDVCSCGMDGLHVCAEPYKQALAEVRAWREEFAERGPGVSRGWLRRMEQKLDAILPIAREGGGQESGAGNASGSASGVASELRVSDGRTVSPAAPDLRELREGDPCDGGWRFEHDGQWFEFSDEERRAILDRIEGGNDGPD